MKESVAVFLIKLVGILPLWLVRTLGGLIGRMSYRSNSRETLVARTNIKHCFGQMDSSEQENLVRNSMVEYGKTIIEIPKIMARPSPWITSKLKQVHNRQLLLDAAKSGDGLLLLCPHIGNWEVMVAELSIIENSFAMYSPLEYPKLDKMLRENRSKSGTTLVPTNKRGVLALIKALKGGGTAMLLPDQTPERNSGSYAQFFGNRALTMTLAYKLVQRTNARVLLASVIRVPGGFDLFYDEMGADFFADDEEKALDAMNRGVEKTISRAPSQYQWEYKRFRRLPSDVKSIY